MKPNRISTESNDNVECVWKKNASKIYKLCDKNMGGKENVDDLFQDVALKFVKNASNLDLNKDLSRWFESVVRTTSYDQYRRKIREMPISYLCEDSEEYGAVENHCRVHFKDEIRDRKVAEELEFLMAELSPNEKMTIHTSYIGGMSMRATANILGRSISDVLKIRREAVTKMRQKKVFRDEASKNKNEPLVALRGLLTQDDEIS
ncbi:MAG: sigma-70 family RNA polymerase sigma factor [Fibrobacter sp.]|nr:sigma-70 family RNA polymerase sigma factor [Fibrobacter sp.]